MQLQSAGKTSSPSRLRRLIIGTALIIGLIIGANAIVLAQLHESVLREVQADLLRQSLTLSELVERTLQSVDLVLTSVADKIQLEISTVGDSRQLKNLDYHLYLKEKISGVPQIDTLGITDSDGKRLNHSRDWPSLDTDLSQREYFQALKANPKSASFISGPMQNLSSGAWIIMLAHPVLTKDGGLFGVVFASTVTRYFEELFRSTSLGDGYAATLLRQDGTLLARYPMAGRIGTIVPASVLNRLIGVRSGVSRSISPIDQEARIAAAYRLPSYPLVIVVTQSEKAAFAAWRTTAVIMVAITSFLILIIIVAAYLIARSWKQQERLNAARAEIIESEKVRALAEVELKRQRELAEHNMRFNAAVENMSQGVCMFDAESKLVVCNHLYGKIYRLPAELLKAGTLHSKIIAHRVRNGIFKGDHGHAAVQRHLALLSALPMDKRSVRIDEHSDDRLIRVTREPLDSGGWVATHEDITERHRAEQELDETKRFLNSIIQNIPFAVVVKDARTRSFVLVNRAFEMMLDLPTSELLGRTVFDFNKPEVAEFITKADSETLRDRTSINCTEYEVETQRFGLRVHATKRIVIRNDQNEPKYLIAVIEDVTERKKTEQRIAFMAHHDALTGLANRTTVVEKIEEAAARQRRWGDTFSVQL